MKLSETILNRILGGGLVLGLVAVSVLLVQGQRQRAERVPTHQQWNELRTQTSSHLTTGDLIRIVPAWDNLGRTVFRGAVAGSEDWPFRALDWREPGDPIAWMGFERLVLVGWKDYVLKEQKRRKGLGTKWQTLVQSGRLLAEAIELPPSPIRWNGRDTLTSGSIEVNRISEAGKSERCKRSRERKDSFVCGASRSGRLSRQPLTDIVQLRMVDVGDVPRECVFFEPSKSHPVYQFTFPSVPLHGGDTILLRAGNALRDDTRYGPARKPKPGRIQVELSVDGKSVVVDDFHRYDNVWIPWAVNVESSLEGNSSHSIAVRLTGPTGGGRQLCFDLYVMGAGWADWGPLGYGHRHGEEPSAISVRRQTVSLSAPESSRTD